MQPGPQVVDAPPPAAETAKPAEVAVEAPKPPDPKVTEDLGAIAIAQRKVAKDQAEVRKAKAEVSADRERMKAILEGDLVATAKARGVDPQDLYRQFTDQLIGRQKGPEDVLRELRADVEGMKQQREAEAKRQAEAAAQAEINGRVKAAFDFISGKQDFEYTQKLGQAAAVEIYREKQGVTLEEAAKAVEAYLEGEIDKLTGYEKFKAKHVAKPAEVKAVAEVKNEVDAAIASRQATKQAKTLTNAQASEPVVKVAPKRMTEEERWQRSIDMIKVVPRRDD